MTSATSDSKKTSDSGKKAGWIHFGIVTGFLLIILISWPMIKSAYGWMVRKEPVPWPARVTVDKTSYQNTSLPDQFGPYKLFKEEEFSAEDLDTLKIGTSLDSKRYGDRESNWYLFRIYEDTREPENSPYRYWILSIVFYTGGETTVPHVPDICAVSGGSRLTGAEFIPINVPSLSAPWNDGAKFKALYYEDAKGAGMVERCQYYLFDVNGEPEVSRDKVRVALTGLTLRYIFYSKIQFYTPMPIRDRHVANAKAKEFLEAGLPSILKELPTKADIDMLYQKETSEKEKTKD